MVKVEPAWKIYLHLEVFVMTEIPYCEYLSYEMMRHTLTIILCPKVLIKAKKRTS